MNNLWPGVGLLIGIVILSAWVAYVIGTTDCPAGKVAVRSVVAYTCVSP